MHSSQPPASPLRPNSSQKMQHLYKQFESLRSRMNSCYRRRANMNYESSRSIALPNSQQQESALELSKRRTMVESQYTDLLSKKDQIQESKELSPQRNSGCELQKSQQIIRGAFERFMDRAMGALNKQLKEKVGRVERKTTMIKGKVKQLRMTLKNRRNSRRSLSKMSDQAQGISEKEKDRETYASSIEKLGRIDTSMYEKQFLKKDGEINRLKIDISKLRRHNDQLLSQIEQLTAKLQPSLKQVAIQAYVAEPIPVQLKKEVSLRLSPGKSFSEQGAVSPKPSLSPIKMPQPSPIVELDDLEADWGLLDEMARPRSMVIEAKGKKGMVNSVKKLEAQVGLISEENNNLRSKNDYFQTQLKHSELDEERFQQQNAIIKDELKRLNKQISVLDDITVLLATQAPVSQDLAKAIDPHLKCSKVLGKQPSKPSTTKSLKGKGK